MKKNVDENYDYLLKNYDKKMDKLTTKKYLNKDVSDETIINLFNELYKMNEYVQDCYKTNNFLHLLNINILQKRGFVIKNNLPEVRIK